MTKWIPDRKYLASGIAGLIAFFAATALGVPAETLLPVVTGAMGLVAYFVPPSVSDVVKRIDDTVINLAVRSKSSAATAAGAAKAGTQTENVDA